MKQRSTTKKSMDAKTRTDWKALDALTGQEIRVDAANDPDVAPVGVEFWKDARVVIPESAVRRGAKPFVRPRRG